MVFAKKAGLSFSLICGGSQDSAARTRCFAIGLAGITFVGDCGASLDVRTKVKQEREMRRIAFLAIGQIEGGGKTVKISFQMDFGGEA